MNFTLENENLSIVVSEQGGELQSIYGKKEQQEYLWQGNPEIWPDRAPNLFPYIARLTNGTYTYQGKTYQMQIHGFVMYRVLIGTKNENELCFELCADEETYKQYPFQFVYRIKYRLEEKSVCITYEVENQDTKKMYFGIGGHPGFVVPFCKDTEFEDYELIFEESSNPDKILMSEDCFVLGKEPWQDLKDMRYSLRHDMFDDDAIILTNTGHSIQLKAKNRENSITVEYLDMNYLGIWHMPKTQAPYICLEPWTSLPSRKNVVEDLETQDNLVALEAGAVYRNTWSIVIA